MLKYLLICLLAIEGMVNAKPVHTLSSDLGSHILIVTPQAQVHLEPALKYSAVAPTTFIQHLSPLARIAAPHEETIIYVPSTIENNLARSASSALAASNPSSSSSSQSSAERKSGYDGKQYEQISQQVEQIQGAIQQGSSALGPQLSEAATAAASAASNAGSGLFPQLFPPAAPPSSPTPAAPAANAEPRRFYALTPAVSHVIDFVHAPVFVGPLSAVRARSIDAQQTDPALKISQSDKQNFFQNEQLQGDLEDKGNREQEIQQGQQEQNNLKSNDAKLEKLDASLELKKSDEQKQLSINESLKKSGENIELQPQQQQQQQQQQLRTTHIDEHVNSFVPASHHEQQQSQQAQQQLALDIAEAHGSQTQAKI